jgi:hypothetical protein
MKITYNSTATMRQLYELIILNGVMITYRQMFELLTEFGFIDFGFPTAKAIEDGIIDINADDRILATPKGQEEIIRRLKGTK